MTYILSSIDHNFCLGLSAESIPINYLGIDIASAKRQPLANQNTDFVRKTVAQAEILSRAAGSRSAAKCSSSSAFLLSEMNVRVRITDASFSTQYQQS